MHFWQDYCLPSPTLPLPLRLHCAGLRNIMHHDNAYIMVISLLLIIILLFCLCNCFDHTSLRSVTIIPYGLKSITDVINAGIWKVSTYICGLRHRKIKAHACSFQNTRLDFKFWSRRRCKGAYIINIVPTNLSVFETYTRLWGCSPTLCFPSFKNNTWILKLGWSFDNTLCTNPKENSSK